MFKNHLYKVVLPSRESLFVVAVDQLEAVKSVCDDYALCSVDYIGEVVIGGKVYDDRISEEGA